MTRRKKVLLSVFGLLLTPPAIGVTHEFLSERPPTAADLQEDAKRRRDAVEFCMSQARNLPPALDRIKELKDNDGSPSSLTGAGGWASDTDGDTACLQWPGWR